MKIKEVSTRVYSDVVFVRGWDVITTLVSEHIQRTVSTVYDGKGRAAELLTTAKNMLKGYSQWSFECGDFGSASAVTIMVLDKDRDEYGLAIETGTGSYQAIRRCVQGYGFPFCLQACIVTMAVESSGGSFEFDFERILGSLKEALNIEGVSALYVANAVRDIGAKGDPRAAVTLAQAGGLRVSIRPTRSSSEGGLRDSWQTVGHRLFVSSLRSRRSSIEPSMDFIVRSSGELISPYGCEMTPIVDASLQELARDIAAKIAFALERN